MAEDSSGHYDIIVLGSGPSGQKAAIQAAKLRKKVAIVEASSAVGGVCTNTGTIPSKSFREAVLYLSGFRERCLYGSAYRVKSRITMQDLTYRIESIVKHEHDVIESQLFCDQIPFPGQIRHCGKVLHRAATASVEMAADRINPVRRHGSDDWVLGPALNHLCTYGLTGQGAGNINRSGFGLRDAVAAVPEMGNGQLSLTHGRAIALLVGWSKDSVANFGKMPGSVTPFPDWFIDISCRIAAIPHCHHRP